MKRTWWEIYCDESRQELFWSRRRRGSRYIVIGGIWLLKKDRDTLKKKLNEIRKQHNTYGEIKWRNVSPSKIDFYKDIARFFYENEIRFRCIIIDKDELNLAKFHGSDEELGFYKFYYQMLNKWIDDFAKHSIYLDLRTSGSPRRRAELHRVLDNANLFSEIVQVQSLPSDESVFIQLVDFLIGAVAYSAHHLKTSSAKLEIVNLLETLIKKKELAGPTTLGEYKFNVFRIRLK